MTPLLVMLVIIVAILAIAVRIERAVNRRLKQLLRIAVDEGVGYAHELVEVEKQLALERGRR